MMPAASGIICILLQAAQSKKGKAAEKSPAEETAKPVVMAAADYGVKSVRENIEAQGQKVREMKAAGTAKVTCQPSGML